MEKTERTVFDEQQSLSLIVKMIDATRERVIRDLGTPFLVMGYVTVLSSLAVWLAFERTGDYRWQLLWFSISAAGIACWVRERRKERRQRVTTYVDRIVGYIWATFGIVAFLQSMLSILTPLPILYLTVLLMGLGTALTGLIVRFRAYTVAGLLSAVVLAPACLLVERMDDCLVFAAAFVVMMVIPGHIFNYRSKHPRKDTNDEKE